MSTSPILPDDESPVLAVACDKIHTSPIRVYVDIIPILLFLASFFFCDKSNKVNLPNVYIVMAFTESFLK